MGDVSPSASSPRGAPIFPRPSRVAALLITAALVLPVSACSSASAPPIVVETTQKGVIVCIIAPDHPARIGSWNTPVASAIGMYYNQSGAPVTITSVSLLNPHNMLFHGAVLYKMGHYAHAIAQISAWSTEGKGALASDWARRQLIPGAVIPAESGPIPASQLIVKKPDLYQVAVDVSVATPGSGWALGVVMNYTASGRSYTINLWAGIGIASSRNHVHTTCEQITPAIEAGFRGHYSIDGS
jgi:hypothetical protein